MSRRGSVKRRCSTCGVGVPSGEKTCPKGHAKSTWSYTVDTAPKGAPRKQVTKSGFRIKDEAVAALAEVQTDTDRGEWVDPVRLTFGEYISDRWLPAVEMTLRPSSFASYEEVLKYAEPLSQIPIQSVTADRLTKLYAATLKTGGRNGTGLAPRTVRNLHIAIRKALNDAVEWRLIRNNPAKLAKPPKAETSLKFWTGEQLQVFLTHVEDDRLAPLWQFLAKTGVRRGEALALRWDNVDLGAGKVRIVESRVTINHKVATLKPKTAAGTRRISLGSANTESLRKWQMKQRKDRWKSGGGWIDSGYVFTRQDGKPYHPDWISKLFTQIVAETGLPGIPLHGLRHSAATVALEAGIHPEVMRQRLGHTDVATTLSIYSHATDRMDEDAAEQIDRALG